MTYLAIALAIFLSFPQVVHEASIKANDLGNVIGPESANDEQVAEETIIPEILRKIAMCESEGRHFDKNGDVVVGVNRNDIGKYQINMAYWQIEAEKLGLDLYSEKGNEAMALELYRKYGTKPWNSSYKCWGRKA